MYINGTETRAVNVKISSEDFIRKMYEMCGFNTYDFVRDGKAYTKRSNTWEEWDEELPRAGEYEVILLSALKTVETEIVDASRELCK